MDDAGATTLLRVEGLGIAMRARCACVDALWGNGGALNDGDMWILAAGVAGAANVAAVAIFALVVAGVARGNAWSPSSLMVTFSLRPTRDGE
jgi:hypothetical protein